MGGGGKQRCKKRGARTGFTVWRKDDEKVAERVDGGAGEIIVGKSFVYKRKFLYFCQKFSL